VRRREDLCGGADEEELVQDLVMRTSLPHYYLRHYKLKMILL
jgi:hypothetical protein